ncbi:MAG: PEP-CTERM sorting domain-containing protein [Planctomycetia bacterium]|nr:PEP-CTERM sorting domain-containing protein [Planctomycetia bacterium]
MNAKLLLSAVILGSLFVPLASAVADPLPGEVLKFSQRPMIATPLPNEAGQQQLYFGHDELSTLQRSPTGGSLFTGTFMADDFADKVESDIVHVRWWGSYIGDPSGTAHVPVNAFLVVFEEDVAADADHPFSHPGKPLSAQIVTPGALTPGTFVETGIRGPDPLLFESLYQYNAELATPFRQKADTVYWLKIVALVDTQSQTQWGWHNRDYTIPDPLASTAPAVSPGERNEAPAGFPFDVWHFQDDAVKGSMSLQLDGLGIVQTQFDDQNYVAPYDGPSIITQFSKDLAFELYRVPEPSSIALLVVGAFGLVAFHRRRRA